jgi:hypothetical protein
VVHAAGVVVDPRHIGVAIARRRVVQAWQPGVTVHALDGALVLRFARPVWVDCALAPGAPLVWDREGPEGLLASAPLTQREHDAAAALASREGTIALVQAGMVRLASVHERDAEDPATYLDVAPFTVALVRPLGPPPPDPAPRIAALAGPTRARLGVGDAPPELGSIVAALRAARTRGPSAPERDEPRSGAFASAVARLGAWIASFFAAPSGGSAVARGGGTSRALVVVPQAPPGPRLFARASAMLRNLFAAALVRARLAPLLGRRQAEYLGRMIDMFERGDLDEALRHAIPLGASGDDSGGDDPTAPMLGLPSRRSALAIFGGRGGSGSSIFAPEDFYAEMRRRYRAAFERLEREGRIEEAAFVLAELLRESAEAVSFLERHHRYELAAELAEARDLAPAVRVRQWLLAANPTRAVLLARRHGVFADAIAALGSDPNASVLRLLWAETLAEAGDFAAAVDVVWPLEDARRVAAAWIEAALAQGGTAGARMLAKRLVLVPGSFDEVHARVVAVCDEGTSTPEERRALAVAWGAEVTVAGSRTLARPLVRAMVRDAGRSGDPELRAVVEKLLLVASDDGLRADVPAWPTVTRTKLADRTPPRASAVAAADCGATPIHDAACLPGGRLLIALGEAGVRLIDGRPRPRPRAPVVFSEPAHALVVSDHGDRALALARRGDAWRVARLDLIHGRSEPWCEARFDAAASTFDGGTWVVAKGPRVLVIDALEERFEALASFELGDARARPRVIARSLDACLIVGDDQGALGRDLYQLPAWTLRARPAAAPPRDPSQRLELVAATGPGQTAVLTRTRSEDGVALDQATLHVVTGGTASRSVSLGALGDTTAAAIALSDRWIAHAYRSPRGPGAGITVALRDMARLEIRATLVLAAASRVSLRLDDRTLTVADDRGRVLTIDLAFGDLALDARV